MRSKQYGLYAFILGLGLAGKASAQQEIVTTTTPAETSSLRFRSGISAGAGFESVAGTTFTMGGIDGRLGAQLNDQWAVYAAPHLSYGSGSVGGGASGTTGTFALTVLGEHTFIERLFVAAGGGYGVLNNPSGPVLHFRAGGYPLLSEEEDGRRKGLVVGVDSRTFFASGLTVHHLMVTIGYEKF